MSGMILEFCDEYEEFVGGSGVDLEGLNSLAYLLVATRIHLETRHTPIPDTLVLKDLAMYYVPR